MPNDYSIVRGRNAVDACSRPCPAGLYALSRLCVMFSNQACARGAIQGAAYSPDGKPGTSDNIKYDQTLTALLCCQLIFLG